MLRGIEAQTDFTPYDLAPDKTRDEKLAIINNSPVLAEEHDRMSFSTTLPFTQGACFYHSIFSEADLIYSDYINVGDPAIYKAGLGTRLLGAGIRHQLEHNSKLATFRTGWARLGLVNTAVAVFGEENVAVLSAGQRFGWNSDKPINSVFEAVPYEPGKPYLVYSIDASIDSERADLWELPTVVAEYRTTSVLKCDR